jgi:hypothetical protein
VAVDKFKAWMKEQGYDWCDEHTRFEVLTHGVEKTEYEHRGLLDLPYVTTDDNDRVVPRGSIQPAEVGRHGGK